MFELDHSHPLARGLIFANYGRTKNSSDIQPGYIIEDSKYGAKCGLYNSSFIPMIKHMVEIGRNGIDCSIYSASQAAYSWTKHDSFDYSNITVAAFIFQKANLQPFYLRNSFNLGTSSPTEVKFADLVVTIPTNAYIGKLSHVVGTFDGEYRRLYIDGELRGELANSTPLPTSTYPIWVGGSCGWVTYNYGEVYDPVIYNRALSPAEIKVLANPTDPMLEGLIRDKKPAPKHWHLGALPSDCKVKTVAPVVIKHDWTSKPVSTPVRLRTDGHWSVKDLHVAFLFNNGAGGITKGLSPDGNDILLPVSNKMTAMGLEVDTFVEPFGFDCSWNTFANGYSLAFGIKRTKPSISIYAKLFESVLYGYTGAESFWLTGRGDWHTIGHTNEYSFGWNVNDASYKQRNIVCSTDIGSAFSFVNDQKYVGVVSGDPENNTLIAGTTKCIIGSYTLNRIPNCAYSHVYVYKRPLTEKESLSLNQNPWQLFTQKNRTIYTYNAKHNIVGTQDANTLKWNWGE